MLSRISCVRKWESGERLSYDAVVARVPWGWLLGQGYRDRVVRTAQSLTE